MAGALPPENSEGEIREKMSLSGEQRNRGEEKKTEEEHVVWVVYWDHYAQDSWLHGSELSFFPDGSVLFENTGMPPGFPVKEWFSSTVDPVRRMEPQLPLLEEGTSYYVRADKDEEPEGGSFLRFNFYDRQGELVSFQLISGNEGSFVCPEGAFRYTLQLVQGGARRIRFRSIAIMEQETGDLLGNGEDTAGRRNRQWLEEGIRRRKRTIRL